MFFFLNLDLPYQRYQNVYFDINCADVVYSPGEKLSLFCKGLSGENDGSSILGKRREKHIFKLYSDESLC